MVIFSPLNVIFSYVVALNPVALLKGFKRRVRLAMLCCQPYSTVAHKYTHIWALAANLNKRNDTVVEEGGWRMRSHSCCYGNSGEQVLGAGRQQVRKENEGRRHSVHSNASSLSPC